MSNVLDDVEHLVATLVGDGTRVAEQVLGELQERLQRDPRAAFAVLRTVKPVLVHHGVAVVTRYPDVLEVLGQQSAFTIEPYVAAMREVTGDFILGLDDVPRYEHDVSLLRLAFPQSSATAVGPWARQQAESIVAAKSGRIDVVRDLADRVPARFVRDFFGVPGPDEDTLIGWARSIFEHIFVNLKKDRIIRERALAAAAPLREHIDTLIARRAAAAMAGDIPDDLLTRLVQQRGSGVRAFDDEEVRDNLIGLLVGAIPTTSKAAVFALDALLDREEALAAAQTAASTGDDVGLARCVDEAMRLAPQAPGLIRRAALDYRVAAGTHHETLVPAGTLVFAATQSAMLDGDVVDDPREFRPGRPAQHYLHYGFGVHRCFGRYVNAVVIPAILTPLLRRPGLRRADGDAGELRIEDNWPTTMTVEYDEVPAPRGG